MILKGVAEPADIRSKRLSVMMQRISDIFTNFGYINLELPLYEYYDILKETAQDFTDEKTIRYIDRSSGKTLVLRPDFTPQVCRSVIGYMSDYPMPLRIAYKGQVFRTADTNSGVKSERFQIGLELFGGDELCGDTEIILATDRALKSVGLTGYKIIIGDNKILSSILSSLPAKITDDIKRVIANKSSHNIDAVLAGADISDDIRKLIKTLPLLFGDISILDKFEAFAKFDKTLIERLLYIRKLATNLSSLGIDNSTLIFDLSESRGLDYYTGISFEIVHSSLGIALGGGGRYDTLMQKFGRDISAAGMAIGIDELMQFDILSDNNESYDYLVVGEKNLLKSAKLRDSGKKVIYLQDSKDIDKFKEFYIFKEIII